MSLPYEPIHRDPPEPGWTRMLSFDPGATFMGWSVIDFNPDTKQCIVKGAGGWHGDRLLKHFRGMIPIYIKAFCVARAVREQCYNLCREWGPSVFASEGAFCARLPQVFVSLSLIINSIRLATSEYADKDVLIVAPMETKKIVAHHFMADKDLMRKMITEHDDLHFAEGVSVPELSEHAIDAIGHGYTAIHFIYFGTPRNRKEKKKKGKK